MSTEAPDRPSGTGEPVEMFGPYRLEQRIGRGGMGEVFRAVDTARERTVAVKRLHAGLADDDEYRERFRRESRTAARLSSPHVVPIHDFGTIDGRLFIDCGWSRATTSPTSSSSTAASSPGGRWRSSARSPTRSTPPTRTGWCTATSSRPTC